MHPTRKRLGIVAAAAAAIALVLTGCSGNGANANSANTATHCTKTQNINFGYIGDFNGTSLLAIANNQNLWAKHCLTAKTQVFTNGPLQITAMASGSLDFGYIGPGALWLPMSGKAVIIAADDITTSNRVVTFPGKGIKTLKDLKGKTVAYSKGTTSEMILRLALQSAGLTMNDINAQSLDYSALTAAMASGKFDAGANGFPNLEAVKKAQPHMITLAKDSDYSSTMPMLNTFVAAPSYAKKNPRLVAEVVSVLKEANDYRLKHRTEAISLVAKMTNVPQDQIADDAENYEHLYPSSYFEKQTKNGVMNKWLESFAQFFVENGTLTKPGSPADYYLGNSYVAASED
jgi:NitT/TauT family transport system substrate-binding protein